MQKGHHVIRLLRIQGWILNSILFSTYCKQTEMVFERGEVLIQYFRRALIDILQQVQNGIDKDCISFWLENLIDLFLRSAHLYQDGGQVLAVLCVALTAVENCRQSEDDPSYGGIIVRNAIAVNSVLDFVILILDVVIYQSGHA